MIELDEDSMLDEILPSIMNTPCNELLTQEIKDSWVEYAVTVRSDKIYNTYEGDC